MWGHPFSALRAGLCEIGESMRRRGGKCNSDSCNEQSDNARGAACRMTRRIISSGTGAIERSTGMPCWTATRGALLGRQAAGTGREQPSHRGRQRQGQGRAQQGLLRVIGAMGQGLTALGMAPRAAGVRREQRGSCELFLFCVQHGVSVRRQQGGSLTHLPLSARPALQTTDERTIPLLFVVACSVTL